MLKYSDDKKPAFFRSMSAEIFFEAEAMDTETVMNDLSSNLSLDAELDEILASEGKDL